jgi:Na+-driven multidrug efflux pump
VVTRPIAVTCAVAASLHPLVNYVLIRPLGLGHVGSALSNAVSQVREGRGSLVGR